MKTEGCQISFSPLDKIGACVAFKGDRCGVTFAAADSIEHFRETVKEPTEFPLSIEKILNSTNPPLDREKHRMWIGIELLRHHFNVLKIPDYVAPDFTVQDLGL